MEEANLKRLYANLLADPYYDRLLLDINKPNIFKILGMSNNELRHSNFLAWLLNPNESHELNDLFLTQFLKEVLLDSRSGGNSIFELAKIDTKDVEVRREWNNIDLLIITKTFVVSIENKIWAKESKHQLKKYKDTVEKHFPEHEKSFVFLTPYGEKASIHDIYINLGYSQIIEILEVIIDVRQHRMNDTILTYIQDYITTLKQVLMKNDNVNQWAVELYKNHKELFDFVWENKPDFIVNFTNLLKEKVKDRGWGIGSNNKGFVRFYTPKTKEFILKYNMYNGWPEKEAFLFEYDFHTAKKFTFRTVITPPKGFLKYDEKLVEVIGSVDGASKSIGEKWKCHFVETKNWALEKMMENWGAEQELKLDAMLEEYIPIIEKVESAFIKHREELLLIKKEFENH